MISFDSLKTAVKNVTHGHFKKVHRTHINPGRDWRIMLLFAVILNAGLIVYDLAVYFDTVEGDQVGLPSASAQRGAGALNRAQLDKALQEYQQKEVHYEKRKASQVTVVDPIR